MKSIAETVILGGWERERSSEAARLTQIPFGKGHIRKNAVLRVPAVPWINRFGSGMFSISLL
jgi:hypothetical protein